MQSVFCPHQKGNTNITPPASLCSQQKSLTVKLQKQHFECIERWILPDKCHPSRIPIPCHNRINMGPFQERQTIHILHAYCVYQRSIHLGDDGDALRMRVETKPTVSFPRLSNQTLGRIAFRFRTDVYCEQFEFTVRVGPSPYITIIIIVFEILPQPDNSRRVYLRVFLFLCFLFFYFYFFVIFTLFGTGR